MQLISVFSSDEKLIQGEFIKPINFCKKNCSKGKCIEFYRSLKNKPKNNFFSCPYGMSVYISSDETIHTCMRERKTHDKNKSKNINDNKEKVYNPILDSEQIIQLIEVEDLLNNSEQTFLAKKSAVDSISHEVKQLNAQIKDRCDVILQTYHLEEDNIELSTQDLHEMQKELRTIYVSSAMIASRFSLYDYEKDPRALTQGVEFPCVVYKKFDKVRKIFKNYMKKSTAITIQGSSFAQFMAYPSFEMIPLLLIENAVKYTFGKKNEISIDFKENNDKSLVITISSFSPYCSKDECIKIFEKGYRGENAKKTSDGTGVGLYFVKMLCDLHHIKIKAESDDSKISKISGVPYSMFKITLEIPNTF